MSILGISNGKDRSWAKADSELYERSAVRQDWRGAEENGEKRQHGGGKGENGQKRDVL